MPNDDQGKQIAASTKQAWIADRTSGRTSRDPSYAVEALQQSVANQMRAQGEAATAKIKGSFKKGGKVPATGVYKLHKGERVVAAKKSRMLADAMGQAGLYRKSK
jgi:hypothetical protein